MTQLTHLTGIRFEGNLIVPDMAADLASGELKGQSPPDFGLQKTDKLEDEIALAWGDAKDYWNIFQRRLTQLDPRDAATSLTREKWVIPLLKLLDYDPVYVAKAETVDGQTFAISHRAEAGPERPPIHAVGARVGLEERPPSGTPRLSAHALVQEYLNRTEHLWGVVTNGLQWRLLRDSSLMTRLTYIEFDLEQILENENFAEFKLFYRLFHRSRLPQTSEDCDECLLEFYHQEAQQQGGRVRDKLRDGVEAAIQTLANGLLKHPQNQALRDRLVLADAGGDVTAQRLYRLLLRLIYRLLFLMVAESRNLLLADDDPDTARIYREYYSIERLRLLAERRIPPQPARSGYGDLWQGLTVTFRLFDENASGQVLGLSPLNGDLFGANTLELLECQALDNFDLLRAMQSLSLYEERGRRRRVNYGALDVEELGSVYESLLDFTPELYRDGRDYGFRFRVGTDRKTSGAYYTPQALVAQLVKSALEPVIENVRNRRGDDEAALEAGLLSLSVCDPACGSGHFLLAAARRIGKELARVRTGEAQPGAVQVRRGVRDAIQHCIYGVDLNPLAVDLCKVALWIEGFSRGMPLNFLDHRIKCGNSLVGVLDLEVLDAGIPDDAFKAVTGDDKQTARDFKKRNKTEQKDIERGQLELMLSHRTTEVRQEYVAAWQELETLPETTTAEVKRKQDAYRQRHSDRNTGWWRDLTACNLWTAAFFMPLTPQNLQLIPTTAALKRWRGLADGDSSQTEDSSLRQVVEAANRIAEQYRFFHWSLEFPDVMETGGFGCVLGNPPWERIKLQEKEFFADKDEAIATAKNAAARKDLICELTETNPALDRAWKDAKHFADAQGKFVRESGRFPLTATGDINTYAVFAETVRTLISGDGYVGVIVPTGIATDATCQYFFRSLVKKKQISVLLDFENRKKLFSEVDSRMRFSLLSLSNIEVKTTTTAFFIQDPNQAFDKNRVFDLAPQEIKLLNPNTSTCPIFRTRADAELTKKIYRRVPVLENEKTNKNPWDISFMTMFHMSNDSNLFLNEPEGDCLPLYEAKMFWQFDHRYSTYVGGKTENASIRQKQDFKYSVTPRYWVDRAEVENKLSEKWNKEWFIAFRDVCRSTDERTSIFSLLPRIGVGHKAPLLFVGNSHLSKVALCLGNLNSLVFDFVARQKIGGTSMSYFILKQLPVLPPESYSPDDIKYISSRVLELVYTAWDMKPFAEDLGYHGDPFIWDEARRAVLRAELDAYYAKLYGLSRDELRYVLDPADLYGDDFPSETFRVLKNNEIKQYGEYRTQRLVLEAFDLLPERP